jgi:hypothetical protein
MDPGSWQCLSRQPRCACLLARCVVAADPNKLTQKFTHDFLQFLNNPRYQA